MRFNVVDLGHIPFKEAFCRQHVLHAQVLSGALPHTLILCEHPHSITLGRGARASSIIDYASIAKRNINFIIGVDRGGEVTYHGPGQLMGYLLFDLRELGRNLGWFLNRIEEVLIETLSLYGMQAYRKSGFRGVWVENRKIASIGIGVQKWVSLHGFGLNVSTDLSFFNIIKPCGLDVEMTSMGKESGGSVSIERVKRAIILKTAATFGLMYNLDDEQSGIGQQLTQIPVRRDPLFRRFGIKEGEVFDGKSSLTGIRRRY